jgi:hypothetical protein
MPWPGIPAAVAFAHKAGYVPREWAATIREQAIAQMTLPGSKPPDCTGYRVMLNGIPLGCGYCCRPEEEGYLSCRGCGAPLD